MNFLKFFVTLYRVNFLTARSLDKSIVIKGNLQKSIVYSSPNYLNEPSQMTTKRNEKKRVENILPMRVSFPRDQSFAYCSFPFAAYKGYVQGCAS